MSDEFVDPFDKPRRQTESDIIDEAAKNGEYDLPPKGENAKWHFGDEPPKLPPEIEEVWGQGRLDAAGGLAALTADYLIQAWGLEAFKASKVHALAVETLARDKAKSEARKMSIDDLPPDPEPM